MTKVKRLPYYQQESSVLPFSKPQWAGYAGSRGCVPLATQKTVSMERLAPGEPAPPPKPKPSNLTPEQRRVQQAEEAREKVLAQQRAKVAAKNQAQQESKSEKSDLLDSEECENPPVFDMLDIPDAMEKEGWPVAAKVARRWFDSPANIYDDDARSMQPIDDTSVTLEWALKFGSVKDKYTELVEKLIYSTTVLHTLKGMVAKKISDTFIQQNSTTLSIDTSAYMKDLRQFHIGWQFQRQKISTLDTGKHRINATDLTGTLGNFAIYAAVGRVEITGERYYDYDKQAGTKTYCFEPTARVTHVYAYIKDSYSFNDVRGSRKSQYLGHWNNTGMVVAADAVISQFLDGDRIRTDMGEFS